MTHQEPTPQTATEAVASILRDYPSGYAADRCGCGWVYTGLDGGLDQHTARHILAAAREHSPIRLDRETIERALRDAGLVEVVAVHEGYGAEEVVHAHLHSVVDAVLAEWPGESRAAVQAEALHDAAEEIDSLYFGPDQYRPFSTGAKHRWGAMQVAKRLRARADRLKKGADRG